MEYLKIPEFPILCGEKAIKALHDFIDELEKERVKELTDKQTTLLIRLAKGLISSIEQKSRRTPRTHTGTKSSPNFTVTSRAFLEKP